MASNVVAVAAGIEHSLYLKSDGTLWAMGQNNYGQLGDGTTIPWNGQVQVSGMALASVVSGRSAQHTLAVGVPLPPVITSQPASQTVLAGSNVTFTVGASGFAPLACLWYFNGNPCGEGTNFSVAGVSPRISGNYTVVVSNAGGSVTSSVAVLMVGDSPSITAQPANQVVAAGGTVSLNVSTHGTGPLGFQWFKNGGMILGATNNALSLANASVMNSGVYYVVVTNAYGMTISQPVTVTVGNPQLLASGYNSYGQLGDGTTADKHLPESVASNVVMAAAGNQHSLYLKSDGTLWAVGYNSNGQLGNGNTANQPTPVFGDEQRGGGSRRECAFLVCDRGWLLVGHGLELYGQLGNGNTADQWTPVFVTNNVVAVAAGHYHSLYIRADGTLYAMGYNAYGQLGNGNTTDQQTPVFVTNNVVAVTAGSVHSLFVTARRHVVGNGAEQLRPVGRRNHDATEQSGVRDEQRGGGGRRLLSFPVYQRGRHAVCNGL